MPERSTTEGLLGVSVAATLCLVALPGATVALLVRLGGLPLSGLAGWAVTAVVSLAYMFAGSKLWSRHARSETLSFGELVLWSWARRRHAEGTLRRGTRLLDESAAALLNPQDRRAQVKVLRELNAALEVRDPYTRGHAKRVERHAHRIALALRCSDEDIFDVRLAASLHDVGKIKVPDRVLRKDGPLDDDEWEIMKQHSEVGAGLVTRLGNQSVIAAVRSHHERWDGRGYPKGLSGTRIPLGARIIAVADTFDAITSCRPYRDRSDRAHAIAVLKSEAGKQFDPAVVTAFLSTTPHQAAAFAGVATLVVPVARKLSSQWGVLFNKAGAVGLAGTMTASAFTGAAAVETPLAKRHDRARKAAAAAPEARPGAPAISDDDEGGSSGTAPSPRGKALGHSKKAHAGGNAKSRAGGNGRRQVGGKWNPHAGGDGKSRAGGNGKSNAGGNGKSNAGGNGKSHAGDNGKSHAGGNGKSHAGDNGKSHAGGNGKSNAGGNGKSNAGGNAKSNAGGNAKSNAGGQAAEDAGSPKDPGTNGAGGKPSSDAGGEPPAAPAPQPAPKPKPAKPKGDPAPAPAGDAPADEPAAVPAAPPPSNDGGKGGGKTK